VSNQPIPITSGLRSAFPIAYLIEYSKIIIINQKLKKKKNYHIHANQWAIKANVAINNTKTAAPYSE
jgi:hypothetical protein